MKPSTPTAKKNPPAKPQQAAKPAPVASDEAAAAEDTGAEVIETAAPAAEPAAEASLGEVTIPQPEVVRVDTSTLKKGDLVMVTMHETIDPAPRVGTFDCRHRLGVQALIARKNYRVPKFVSEVLIDAGKAEIISFE